MKSRGTTQLVQYTEPENFGTVTYLDRGMIFSWECNQPKIILQSKSYRKDHLLSLPSLPPVF